MKKDKVKSYTVNKRFTVWVSTKVVAEDLHDAVHKAEALKASDFMTFEELIDDTVLPGTSVAEDWD